MRKLVLAFVATAAFGTMGVTAEAMPAAGSSYVAPTVTNPAVQKTVAVVIGARARPRARRVCRTVVTAGRRVTRCHN